LHCKVCFYTDDTVDEAVCRRCARNFSRSELGHVIGLTALYVIVCRLSYYLFTGDFFSGLWKGNLAGPYNLSAWGESPVSIVDYPLHLVTVGWLLGVVLVFPVLVGAFYGLKAGVVVALAGGLFAGLPVLFVVTVPAAVIAGTGRHRRIVGGVAIPSGWLASLLPVVYAVAVTLGAVGRTGIVSELAWVVGILAVVLHLELAGLLTRRGDWRGTFLLKTLVVETVLLFGFFHVTVGFDTVEYECVRARAWCLGERFRIPPGLDARGRSAQELGGVLDEHLAKMTGPRERSVAEFEGFLDVFPRSRFAPLALYELAELANMRLHVESTAPLIIRIHTDRVSPEAVAIYQRIIGDFNDSPAAAYARLKLADYAAQHGSVTQAARDYVTGVVDVYETHLSDDYRPGEYSEKVLQHEWRTRRSNTAMRHLVYWDVMSKARVRRRFILANTDYNDIPLILYLQTDPRALDRHGLNRVILEWFPSAKVVDNVLWDRTYDMGLKLSALEQLYRDHPTGDVAPRVLLHLAGRFLKERTYDPDVARKYYETLLSRFGDSPEAETARKELGAQINKETGKGPGS